MTKEALWKHIQEKGSYLCVGLDTDVRKIPAHLLSEPDPVFAFNRQIIDATADHCVAYKLNTAFYESEGINGWQSLQKTIDYIPESHFTIADAKRGDIGNTSQLYARAFFEHMPFDSITVSPYMGEDSVKPFMAFENKWVILLALTSNTGSGDFQTSILQEGELPLFEKVIATSKGWGDNLMYVVGATKAAMFTAIRSLVPDHFLLVPGVGAQGGDLEAVSRNGLNRYGGLLVNSSRGIIYASDGQDFAQKAGEAAQRLRQEMKNYLEKYV